MDEFLKELNTSCKPSGKEDVFKDIWSEYEKVVIRSILTTFGFDLLITDQRGGDVDTIHSVRDKSVGYKNADNQRAYESRPEYNTKEYHSDERYDSLVRNARESQKFFQDEYDPHKEIYYGKASYLKENQKKANLDHVISAKEIHEDPGRILAGIDGKELANSRENLKFTNDNLNKRKGQYSVEEFIERTDNSNNPLDEDTKANMRRLDKETRESYNKKISKAYYTSEAFAVDMAYAATQLGARMALRQALGFVAVEIWMSCKKEVLSVRAGGKIEDYFSAVKHGIDNGILNVKNNYRGLFEAFGEGFFSGIVTSIATTLINAFVTTGENTVRNLRQTLMFVTQAGNILLFNPNELPTGERIRVATITLASGAASIAGLVVGDYLGVSPLATIPVVGESLVRFSSIIVSGLLSCTFLLILDRSKIINMVVDQLNLYQTVDYTINEICRKFEEITAEIEGYNIDEFVSDSERLSTQLSQIAHTNDENVLSSNLELIMSNLAISVPWIGDFDDFMSDDSNTLNFS